MFSLHLRHAALRLLWPHALQPLAQLTAAAGASTTTRLAGAMAHAGAAGPHDVGGEEAGPLNLHEHKYDHWERQTHALLQVICHAGPALCARKKLWESGEIKISTTTRDASAVRRRPSQVLIRKKLTTLDEHRKAQEALPKADYDRLSYYEK